MGQEHCQPPSPLWKGILESQMTHQGLRRIQKTDTGPWNDSIHMDRDSCKISPQSDLNSAYSHENPESSLDTEGPGQLAGPWPVLAWTPGTHNTQGSTPARTGRGLKGKNGSRAHTYLSQHCFKSHGPQPCGEDLASLPKCEALGEKKGFCPFWWSQAFWHKWVYSHGFL